MNSQRLASVIILSLGTMGWAQMPTGSLKIVSRVNVPLHGALAGKARCDASGAMYFRVLNAVGSRERFGAARAPITKMGLDGHFYREFNMPNEPSDLVGFDFFVTPAGAVYLAAERFSDQSAFVIEFAGSGKSTVIPLNLKLIPRQIAVFKSGDILVSGTNGDLYHTPFTAIFDANGNMIKKIYEPEDENARQRADALDPKFVDEGMRADNMAVVQGDVALGADGNAYLLRAMSPSLVYVISSKGDVIRKLHLEAPSPGLRAQQIKDVDGRLAVAFLRTHSAVGTTEIFDLNGTFLGQLDASDRDISSGLPGCYESGSFYYLHTDSENAIFLSKAEPK